MLIYRSIHKAENHYILNVSIHKQYTFLHFSSMSYFNKKIINIYITKYCSSDKIILNNQRDKIFVCFTTSWFS